MTRPVIPFFVLGHPRSGTTALARLLNGIDAIACLHYEGNLLYRLCQTLQRVAVLDEPVEDLLADFEATARHNLVHRARQAGEGSIIFSEDGVTGLVRSFQNALQSLHDPVAIYARVSQEFFGLFREVANRKIVGDKVPDFMFVPDRITAPHPECRAIVITRDPRAVVHSALRFGRQTLHLFAVDNAFALALMYCLRHQVLQAFLRSFPHHRVFKVTQEELRRAPAVIGERARRFFGLRRDRQNGESAFPGRISQRPTWRTAMAPEDRAAVEAVCAVFGATGLSGIKKLARSWQEKAAGLLPLRDCDLVDIPALVRHALPLFPATKDKRTLGLALVQFADLAHKRSHFSRAGEFFAQAAVFLSQDPIFWYKYASLCYDMKLLAEARRCMARFDACCPKTPYYNFLRAKKAYLMAMTERIGGSTARARACLNAALALKPDFLLPKALLAVLA